MKRQCLVLFAVIGAFGLLHISTAFARWPGDTLAGGVAWPQPCSVEGPHSVDENTLLLLHFDNSYTGAQGEVGSPNGTTFTSGKYAQGVTINAGDTLTYTTTDNLNRTQGAIEFWLRPSWDGGDNATHVFFEVGNDWFNRMRILKDGANNLRFLLWDSTTEYGVGYNVADWQIGEWHHIAVIWIDTNIALYADGIQLTNTTSANPPELLADPISVGSSLLEGGLQANADMDEFRISDIPRVGDSDTCTHNYLPLILNDPLFWEVIKRSPQQN